MDPLWRSHRFRLQALEALAIFALSCIVNYFAGTNATELASNWVTDVVLTNTKPMGSMFIHLVAPLFLDVFAVAFLIKYPRYLPFVGKSLAFIVFARAIFINLTHLGIYPDALPVEGSLITFGGDLFYSNHTAIPILLAFTFRREFPVTAAFLFGVAAVFGINSVLAHVHYTIDVAVAPFMAYGIYAFTQVVCPRDYALIAPKVHQGVSRVRRS